MAFTEASSPGPGRAWRGGFMVFLLGALCYTICTMKTPPQALPGPGEESSRAWRGGFMVFLLGALCYTICTMKAPPQALPGPGEEPSCFHRIYFLCERYV